jgi:ribose transport system substrate-binding protein
MMMTMRKVVMLAAMMAVICGCGGSPEGDASKPEKLKQKSIRTIGVSVLTMNNPFFKEIADSMQAEAVKHGFEVVAVSGDFDVARQQNQIKDFIVKKVSAIVLCPCDSKAIGPAIQEANAAGIPVFTADIACIAPGAKIVSHVATDNYLGGKMAAEAMVEALGGRGKVAILDHPEVESVLLRTRGFQERLAELKRRQMLISRS